MAVIVDESRKQRRTSEVELAIIPVTGEVAGGLDAVDPVVVKEQEQAILESVLDPVEELEAVKKDFRVGHADRPGWLGAAH
jgi:hypothetical protein